MPVSACYALAVLIWGLTWAAIHVQVAVAPVDISVLYRFVLAASISLGTLWSFGKLPRFKLHQHGWLMAQGLALYSANYLLVYQAAEDMTSGLLAVLFSLASLFNALNGWLWFRQRPTPRLYPATLLGVGGVTLLFWRDVTQGDATLASVVFAIAGTYVFSCGNLISLKVRAAGVPLLAGNSWSMLYGMLFIALWCVVDGADWVLPGATTFWWATLFLAVPGSIVAFACYLIVVRELGADRAGYATVLFPVVALAVSTWLEGFQWSATSLVGAALAIAGNLVLLAR